MAALELVIFDCDGVLVDSEPICNGVMAQLLGEMGWELTLQETVDRFMGRSLPQCALRIEQHFGHALPGDFQAQLAQRTQQALRGQLKPVAGIEAVLDGLTVPYCVASNGNRAKMNATLGMTGLLPRFAQRMHCAGDVARPKPAPDLFLHAAQTHGAQPGRCVVIEDTPTGITAARAAGMRALGHAAMMPAQRLLDAGAHAVFTRMGELPALLWPRCAEVDPRPLSAANAQSLHTLTKGSQ